MRRYTLAAAILMLWLALPAPLRAGQAGSADRTPTLIVLGAGAYDVVQRDDVAADFRLELRPDLALWRLRPWAGLEVTSDGAVYGAAGLLLDLELGSRVVLTPSFGVGAYHDGGGKDLGSVLEFRSQIELAWRFDDASRLGLAFSHISNASVAERNPGSEIVTLSYMVPLDQLF